MNFKELCISPVVVDYFTSNQKKLCDLGICNAELEKTFGIKTFFNNINQLNQFVESHHYSRTAGLGILCSVESWFSRGHFSCLLRSYAVRHPVR